MRANKLNVWLKWGVISLVTLYLFNRFFPSKKPKFTGNHRVDSAISVIDVSLGAFGTFNSDHEQIFEILENLTGSEIKKLHSSYGTRFLHPLGYFQQLGFFGSWGISKEYNLLGLFHKEFDDNQIERLKYIYLSKGCLSLLGGKQKN